MRALAAGVHARPKAPIAALLSADGVSEVGNEFAALALPWLVLETTGSAARAGLVVAAGTAAGLVGGVFGGALVDRLGHKRASVAADLASAAAVALVPFLRGTVGLVFWQLLALVFLGALLDAPGRAARQSLFPDLARLAGLGLERANGTAQVVYRAAGLLGPPLAGLLVAAFGPDRALWINAASFVVSAGLVAVAVPALRPDTEQDQGGELAAPSGYLAEVREGFRFVRGDRVLLWLVAGFSLGNLLAEPVYAVVLPVYANQVFGSATALGVLYAALALGSLFGNALFFALAPRLPRRGTIVAGFAVRALTFWALVPLPPLPVVAGSIVVNATFLEPANPIWQTLRQERVPARLRGRVFGTLGALGAGSRALGFVAYGLLIDGIGLGPTLLVLAATNVTVPLLLWFAPGLRELGSPADGVQRRG